MKYPGNIKPGDKYGHLTAVKFAYKGAFNKAHWVFKCDCGSEGVVKNVNDVKKGNTKSCGCLLKEQVRHGLYKTTEYRLWISMKERCYNEKNLAYPNYGGRGITVCDEWLHSITTFYRDMGPRPSKRHSIDRIDVNGNYCKENCKWSTDEEQCANRRSNVWMMYKGRKMLQEHIIKEMGITPSTFRMWRKRWLTPDEIGVYHHSGKWWHRNVIITCVLSMEFNGDFSKLIPHGDYVVVSHIVHADNNVCYKLIAKGKLEDYPHLLQS